MALRMRRPCMPRVRPKAGGALLVTFGHLRSPLVAFGTCRFCLPSHASTNEKNENFTIPEMCIHDEVLGPIKVRNPPMAPCDRPL
eukprot:9398668-Pyramimonas_sp.AAC.1